MESFKLKKGPGSGKHKVIVIVLVVLFAVFLLIYIIYFVRTLKSPHGMLGKSFSQILKDKYYSRCLKDSDCGVFGRQQMDISPFGGTFSSDNCLSKKYAEYINVEYIKYDKQKWIPSKSCVCEIFTCSYLGNL